ncbi:hypothetical protein [Oceanicoccus sp. KOV_DT_Chl]|uniref:hypothetical protein n=1 Tax=Oceanicoccus sp. KOV_DT_Chl TaxID=1904639 RepID=UPI0011AF5540|nr:hypothetical protein [Oceanicoccus sp. KOV_DT_Chl]
MIYSNASIYKEIAEEAYSKMCLLLKKGRTPKDDGSGGYIIKYDDTHNSFKQSMIVVVFTGMWLEAILHQLIVSRHGNDQFKKYDFKPYREKLVLLGVSDSEILDKVDLFKATRKELVHEKAFFDSGEIKVAQKEAELAHQVISSVSHVLGI